MVNEILATLRETYDNAKDVIERFYNAVKKFLNAWNKIAES